MSASLRAREWGNESRLMFQKTGMISWAKRAGRACCKSRGEEAKCALEGGEKSINLAQMHTHAALWCIRYTAKPSYTYNIPWGICTRLCIFRTSRNYVCLIISKMLTQASLLILLISVEAFLTNFGFSLFFLFICHFIQVQWH